MKKFKVPKKQNKAPWVGAFKRQARALRPENAGQGVKSRSGGEKARMAVYLAIKEIWLRNPLNLTCRIRATSECSNNCSEIHHSRGRGGILLFDVRYWLPVCNSCHSYLHAYPAEARAKGWLAQPGEWNKETE